MMKAKVRGFRGCEKGDVDISNIALVAGLNGAGKSSLLQAIAAAATGQPIPFFRSARPEKPILTKGDAKFLLRGGMDKGSAVITLDGNTCAAGVDWPLLSVVGNGTVQCSLIAAGLVNPMEMEEHDRQRFFSTLLDADPTIAELREAIVEAIPEAADPTDPQELEDAKDERGKTPLDNIVAPVELNGWDVAHKAAKERGAKRKGAWEERAGVAFGSKKAANWRPEGWKLELEEVSLEDLGTSATNAQTKLESAIAAVAVDAAALTDLKDKAKGEATAYNAMQEAKGALDLAQEDLKKKENARQAIVIPTAEPCPHCGGLLDISFNTDKKKKGAYVIAESKADSLAINEAKADFEAASRLVTTALDTLEARQKVYDSAKQAHDAVKGSTDRLMEAEKRTGTDDAVAVARDYLAGILKDKDMVERVQGASALAEQIANNQKLVDILAPEGLRRQKLQKALATFNKSFLGVLSATASYSTVTIDDGLEILYGGRRYFLLSESEKYRVRAVVQIAVAMYDKSPLVIFDGADILDQDGRNGLFAMMGDAEGLKFLVGMTVLARKNVPNLGPAGLGNSYWVAEGTVEPLVAA